MRVFCARIGPGSSGLYPCDGVVRLSTDLLIPEYRVTGLNPFSAYSIKMEVEGRSLNGLSSKPVKQVIIFISYEHSNDQKWFHNGETS